MSAGEREGPRRPPPLPLPRGASDRGGVGSGGDEDAVVRGGAPARGAGAGALALPSVAFRREREAAWDALEQLLGRVDRVGLTGLHPAELFRLPILYRQALSSLSVARAISLDQNLLGYLEALAARAYVAVHGARRPARGAALRFVAEGFPRAVRALGPHLGLAAALLVLAALAGAALCASDPARYDGLMGGMAQGRSPASSTAELRAALYGTGDGDLSLFAAFLFHHNASIGIVCLALGFVAGLPTFFLLLTNGLVLGAFAWLYASRGLGVELWAWLLPHGVTELLSICLFGAAGFALAQGFLFPGRLGRLVSLARRGREAGRVAVGAVFLMLLAGLIEGFFRQLVHGLVPRYGLALGSAALWVAYFGFAGRARDPALRAPVASSAPPRPETSGATARGGAAAAPEAVTRVGGAS